MRFPYHAIPSPIFIRSFHIHEDMNRLQTGPKTVLLYSECLIAFCAHLSVLAEGALLINGTDCTGHARVVNAREREVDCPPAVNTVQVPVVDAAWEIQLLKVGDTRVIGCEKVVLFRNQSVVYYERKRISFHSSVIQKLLVNTSMSEVECQNSYKTAYNTTRPSDCCRRRYHHFLAVNKDHGSLILYDGLAKELFGKHILHGIPATCSVTGSKGRTASSSFTITTLNGEPNHMHCMYCGNVMLHMCMVHVSYLVHELRLEWMYLEGRVCIVA